MSRPERVVAADNEVQELVAKARKAQAVYEFTRADFGRGREDRSGRPS